MNTVDTAQIEDARIRVQRLAEAAAQHTGIFDALQTSLAQVIRDYQLPGSIQVRQEYTLCCLVVPAPFNIQVCFNPPG
jgi:hypothetical protein